MAKVNSQVSDFVAAAREFCAWLEKPAGVDPEAERFTALVLLAQLHASALVLPEVDESTLGAPPREDSKEEAERRAKVMARLETFPTRAYWRLEGESTDGGEKVRDDVGRDLFVTYAAVRPLLDEFDSRPDRRGPAIWSWRYTFWSDWGKHSTNAIQVLHQHFHDKAWSGE